MPAKLKRPGPAGGKRDENRRARLRELQLASVPLFLAQGIEGTTIDDIVDAAGVAKGSFYRYFADKEALLRSLYAPLSEGLSDVFARGQSAIASGRTHDALLETYQQLAFGAAAVMFAHRDIVLLYLQESRARITGPIGQLNAMLRKWSLDMTISAHKRKLLKKMDPRITSLAVLGASEALLLDYLRQGDAFSDPVTLAQTLISMVLDGMRP